MARINDSLRSPTLPAAAADAQPRMADLPRAADPTRAAGMQLAELATGAEARVISVSAAGSTAPVELGRRLAELGFLPGESLRIVARGMLGREPIAVRIGTSTFALRLFEAACIRVCPELPQLR